MTETEAKIVPIEKVDGELVGGKAKGLALLSKCGLNVPQGFVIVGEISKIQKDKIVTYYQNYLGNTSVAVRSSAIDEDTDKLSSAGQYLTLLNVKGANKLLEAIEKCASSINDRKVVTYKKQLSQSKENNIAIIVQKMVDAKKAGVVFTKDPLGKNDHIIINAIEGLGDELVGGRKQAEEFIVNRGGQVINSYNNKLLKDEEIRLIVEGALKAERFFNKPLDLEWAIDKTGKLFWLQARPITTINSVSINELDTRIPDNNRFFTRANVGEMLPGAVTPLSISIFAEAIDIGLRWMYQKTGVISKKEKPRFVCNFYNHLFFDVTNMYKIIESVLGASKESFDLNIFGRVVADIPEPKKKSLVIRAINGIKYSLFINGHKKALKRLKKLADTFKIDISEDISKTYENIDKEIETLYKAYYYHYQVSAHSGAMNGALTAILGNGKFTKEALSKAAFLLSAIKEVESANILESLEKIARAIVEDKELIKSYYTLGEDVSKVRKWLESSDAKQANELYLAFLKRHGHRTIREAELREKDWFTDPSQPIGTIMTLVKRFTSEKKRADNQTKEHEEIETVAKELGIKGIKKKILHSIYNQAKQGMRNRELSKSLVIKVQSQFRYAYRTLASLMVKKELLPDEDLIYFLKHNEIGKLIANNEKELVIIAQRRKKLFAQQQILQFPELTYGKPEPIELKMDENEKHKVLQGVPVSRGKVKGKVRIVRTIEDAEKLQPNEIMVAEFTDVGWSPYFSIIAGLITEIGGSLSHGAIVAREYGLPFVSGIHNATKILKDGQEVIIDGEKGTVTLLA